jgi:predicted nucleotidyltransferase component of viral defense system
MLKQILEDIVSEKKKQGAPDFVIKNFLKEFLQYPVLEFIYSHPMYKSFIFTGGSCLRVCYDAPRLSEDLDFDLEKKEFAGLDLKRLSVEIKDYFEKRYSVKIQTKCQGKTRIYLKFSILSELGLARGSESNFLFVKIEPSPSPYIKSEPELTPVSRFGFNFLARHYSLEFLMTGKLNAVFNRQWFKGKENKVNIKGRDFYDLFWYFQKGIEPDYKNLKRLVGISNGEELKKELKSRIKNEVTAQKLSYDLKNFFPDQSFVSDFCKNYSQIMEKFLR